MYKGGCISNLFNFELYLLNKRFAYTYIFDMLKRVKSTTFKLIRSTVYTRIIFIQKYKFMFEEMTIGKTCFKENEKRKLADADTDRKIKM